MGRGEAESGMNFYQENLLFHALFDGYFKFMPVLRYIKEWLTVTKRGFFCLVGEDVASKL